MSKIKSSSSNSGAGLGRETQEKTVKEKTEGGGLLVSSTVLKKLENYHSVLTRSENLSKLRNQQLFLDP